MIRGLMAALAIGLAGCGFMQVGERPIPAVPGAVATTAWQSQEPTLPGLADDAADATTPEAFLELVVTSAIGAEQLAQGGLQYGVLGRSGNEASAYLQLTDERLVTRPVVAFEAHLTLALASDGRWSLSSVKTREQCGEALTNGSCGDNSGAGEPRAPAPAPSTP